MTKNPKKSPTKKFKYRKLILKDIPHAITNRRDGQIERENINEFVGITVRKPFILYSSSFFLQ